MLQPEKDKVIYYVLLPKDRPTDQRRVWKGRIIQSYPNRKILLVESLEAGYAELTELVRFDQIIFVFTNEFPEPPFQHPVL